MARSYRHMREYEEEIIRMKEEGYTGREICERFGFTTKQYKGFITRYNRKQEKIAAGIRDLYDNSIVAYKTGTEQSIQLVLSTIRSAKRKEKVTAELQLHSDQGFQYTSQAYFRLTQSYGITPSMSRRGNPYDNALAENFFSILKTECIYRVRPRTNEEARLLIGDYIHFYNYQRIQLKNKTDTDGIPMPVRCLKF